MHTYAKRMFAAIATTLLLTVGLAGSAAAAPGPAACLGPPGQVISFVARNVGPPPQVFGAPPGEGVSYCAQLSNPGHG